MDRDTKVVDDGKNLYFVTPQGQIRAWPKSGGPAFDVATLATPLRFPKLAAFGGYVYVASNDAIQVIDPSGSKFTLAAPGVSRIAATASGLLFESQCAGAGNCLGIDLLAFGSTTPQPFLSIPEGTLQLLGAFPTVGGNSILYGLSTTEPFTVFRQQMGDTTAVPLLTSTDEDHSHPPIAINADTFWNAFGESGSAKPYANAHIEHRSIVDGMLLGSFPTDHAPDALIADLSYVYWDDPGWIDLMPYPSSRTEPGGRFRMRLGGGSAEKVDYMPAAVDGNTVYFLFGSDLRCVKN